MVTGADDRDRGLVPRAHALGRGTLAGRARATGVEKSGGASGCAGMQAERRRGVGSRECGPNGLALEKKEKGERKEDTGWADGLAQSGFLSLKFYGPFSRRVKFNFNFFFGISNNIPEICKPTNCNKKFLKPTFLNSLTKSQFWGVTFMKLLTCCSLSI